MTTPPDAAGPVDPDGRDELASAYLDGASSPEENAVVERDVDLLRRVEMFAAVRGRLATNPLDPELADAHLARALDEFATPAAEASGDEGESAPVASLAGRRRSWTQRVPFGAVAAAVAVIALVAGVITQVDLGTESADVATGAADDADSTLDAGALDDGAAGLDASGGATPSAGSGDSLEAGDAAPDSATARRSYVDLDELAADLRQRLDAGEPEDGGDSASPFADDADGAAGRSSDPCDALAVLDIDPDAVLIVEPVMIDGRPFTAVVFITDDGERLGVVDDGTCDAGEQRPL